MLTKELNMVASIILILGQLASFQVATNHNEPPPRHLIQALEHYVCSEPYEDGFYDLVKEYEKTHKIQLDDDIWLVGESCND